MAPPHVDFFQFVRFETTPDLLLDSLCGRVADQAAIFASHIRHNRFIKSVASNANRVPVDHAIQGNDRDLCGAAADVDDHATCRLFHLQARPNRCSHGLFDQFNFSRPRTER